MKRGFTLIELMIVVSISGVIAAAAGAFWLQGRLSAARIEAQVRLQREASLVSEVVARDLRGAARVDPDGAGLVITPAGGGPVVRYRLEGGVLARHAAGEPWVLSRLVERISTAPWVEAAGARGTTGLRPSGLELRLTVARDLAGRRMAFERDTLVRRAVR